MDILRILMLLIFMGTGVSFAATVDLTDGRSVQGDITQRDSKSLQITVDGVNMTYYADEIKDVDGGPLVAPAAPPAPAPVVPAALPAPISTPDVNAPAASDASAIDPDKRALILKFIDVFGTRQALNNNFETMLAQMAKDKPEEVAKIRDRVKVDEIIERLLPIYDRNFSSDELKSYISFYGSDEGKKLIGTIPELMKESVTESVKYMEEKFPEAKSGS